MREPVTHDPAERARRQTLFHRTRLSARRRWGAATLMIAAMIGTSVLTGVAPTGLGSEAEAQLARPNVLLIVTDDQRAGMTMMPKTVQYFAREGRSYPQAFVTTPLCCPSRASIMTGRYVHNHGVKGNSLTADFDHADTLQAQLKAQGYRTAMFGKFFNGWPRDTPPPHFDDYAVTGHGYTDMKWNVKLGDDDPGSIQAIPGYHTDVVGDKAEDFIESRRGKDEPWMILMTPYAPHAPFTAEPAYRYAPVPSYRGNPATVERDRSDKPPYVRARNYRYGTRGRRMRERQFRTLLSVDDMITRVMGTLRRTGQENTIAVFLSDNGLLWGEHGVINKRVPYTQAVKVPFYLRWPGRVAGGSVDSRMVANIDVVPTLLAAAGAPPGDRDGRDVLDATWRRNRLLLEHFAPGRVPPWASTRTPTYQYTEYYDDNGRVAFREYYDLTRDPWQLVNLYRDGKRGNNPRIAPLRDQLRRDGACAGTACP